MCVNGPLVECSRVDKWMYFPVKLMLIYIFCSLRVQFARMLICSQTWQPKDKLQK